MSRTPVRVLEREILDDLPPDDPAAKGSRRDLKRVNFFMGNATILRRLWKEAGAADWATEVVEIGAGDGSLLLQFLREIRGQNRLSRAVLLDRQETFSPQVTAAISALAIHPELVVADVFAWITQAESSRRRFIFANLFLHHFAESQLEFLFAKLASCCQAFAACEPRRMAHAGVAPLLLALIGCNRVTKHDGYLSVRAGFANKELSQLWPTQADWTIAERRAGLFSHSFLATHEDQ